MKKKICIYCSSSDHIAPIFFDSAKKLASLIAQKGHALVFGGGCIGLMGELARTTHSFNGEVIGVIPDGIHCRGIGYEQADKYIITKDMRERKATMEEYSDAFIALPGGFGTLEEIFEMLTSKQLQFHNKPIVFMNINNFYTPLFEFFDHIYEHKFAKPESSTLYYVTEDPNSAISFIEEYQPGKLPDKWHMSESKV